jgi:hypothetical protein
MEGERKFMGIRTMAPKFSDLTNESQKAVLSSFLMQNYIKPMEWYLLSKQFQLVATLEGKQPKALDEKDLALFAARNEIADLETRLAMLAASMTQGEEDKGEDDGE